MKKLILTGFLMIASLVVNAQGVITVEKPTSDVPIEQWYVIRNKKFKNYSFYYAERNTTLEELKRILKEDDQSIDFPKGKDKDGDDYWIIMYENEFISYFYLSQDGVSEFWNITVVTE